MYILHPNQIKNDDGDDNDQLIINKKDEINGGDSCGHTRFPIKSYFIASIKSEAF